MSLLRDTNHKSISHGCQKKAKKLVRTKLMLGIGWRMKPAPNPHTLMKGKLTKIRRSKCLMIDYGQFLYIAWDSKISCGNWFSICRLIHKLIYCGLIEAPSTAIFESALQSGSFWMRYKSGIVWTLNADIFFNPVTKEDWAQFFTVILHSRRQPRSQVISLTVFTTHALLPMFPEEPWELEWIRVRVGYVWTGKLDWIRMRVDVEIFESRKKKLRIQKYPDTCGRGLSD